MRDILITVIILGLVPWILRSPSIGTYAWTWISLMVPHKSTFGFAYTMPFAQIVAIPTLLSLLFSRERRPFPASSITAVYMALILWMTLTCVFAINTPDVVLERWVFVLKIHVMLFVTMMLLRGRQQIERLVWVVVLSLGLYGVKGGVWTVLTGGGERVWGPPGGMAYDNNAFGLTLVLLLPFIYYLLQVSARRAVRLGLIFSMVAITFAILGTHSRGALLALISMAGFLALKGKRPLVMIVLLACGIMVAVLSMPESWTGRMKTIETYEEDTSAMSRIYTWKTMWALAVDRPLVGGGFVVDIPEVYAIYAPREGAAAHAGSSHVAHSIYFQMLGEHGFPGLVLYLMLGVTAWRKASKIARQTRDHAEYGSWVPMLMKMVQVSLAGFAVGGAFLSLAHFDLTYYIVSLVVLVDATLREDPSRAGPLTADSRVPAIEATSTSVSPESSL